MSRALFVVIVVVVAVAMVGLSGSARALRPDIQKLSMDATFSIVNCNGFSVIRQVVALFIFTTHFDREGVPTELKIHITEHNTISNSVTGKFLAYPGVLNFRIDLTDGTVAVAGAPLVLTIQHEGIVIQDTGLLITDANGNWIFEAGSHDFGPTGDPAVFCPLLE